MLFAVLSISCHSEQHAETHVVRLLETSASWNGAPLPEFPEGQPRITVLRIFVPPQTRLAVHKHPVISAGVLLQGELKITTESGETLRLQAGDAISEVVNTWHYGVNTGVQIAELIVFYAGVEDAPITVHQKSGRD